MYICCHLNYNKMRKLVLGAVGALALWACNNTVNNTEDTTEVAEAEVNQQKPTTKNYGATITEDGAVKAEKLMASMGNKDSLQVKVEGTINSSCKMKGCWMKMDMGNGKEMRVSFKDYGFFVPKNLDGETAVIDGYAKMDTTDVMTLQHFARDAGKSEAEVKAITEPEIGVTYVATGVIIKE